VLAESSKNDSSTNPNVLKSQSKDELFIDDESDTMLDEEGSGMGPISKGTGAEDMESSGSGYGPDDEDAQVGGAKNKGKAGIDSEEDEDEDDIDDDEDIEDFDKEKQPKVDLPITTTTTTTTSTTTTTTENYYDESRILLVCSFNYFPFHLCEKNTNILLG